MIPPELILETSRAYLRPLRPDDFEPFLQLAQDADAWTYFTLNLANKDHLSKWMEAAFREKDSDSRRPFTIIDKPSQEIAGSTSLGNISYYDLRLEIGWSWLGKEF